MWHNHLKETHQISFIPYNKKLKEWNLFDGFLNETSHKDGKKTAKVHFKY